jgi:hypothetical protein
MEKCRALDGKLMDYILALWNFGFSIFSGIAAYKVNFTTLKIILFRFSYCLSCFTQSEQLDLSDLIAIISIITPIQQLDTGDGCS